VAQRGHKKLLARKNRGHNRLTPIQKEAVVHIFHTVGSISGTAMELGINAKTVKSCLDEANTNPELGAVRAHALTDVAAKINGVTNQIIDSIGPDDIHTERREVFTEKGSLKDVKIIGPSLKDKAICVAILTDKQKVITETIAGIKAPLAIGGGDRALLLPSDLHEARRLVAMKVKKLRLVDIEFDTGEAGEHIKETLVKVGLNVDDAEYEQVVGEPFD